MKRVRQMGSLLLNSGAHHRSRPIFRRARTQIISPLIQFKYLGDYLSLSFSTSERLRALAGHYQRFGEVLHALAERSPWPDGIAVWELPGDDGEIPPLRVLIEPSELAPMEGEIQIRFAAGDQTLFTLTFLLAPGDLFGLADDTVIFVGGVQGGVNCRIEMRQAAKRNGEIAPAAMLLLTLRSFATVLGVKTILAVSESDQIAQSYASDKLKLDYRDFWAQAGGYPQGACFVLANNHIDRPLHDIPISHRRRTRRKRERRDAIRAAIEARLRELLAL